MSLSMFKVEVQRCLRKASDMYGIDLTDTEVSFNIRGRCGGRAIASCNTIGKGRDKQIFNVHDLRLQFNATAIDLYYDEMVNETIPHEVAHLVCYMRTELGNSHDAGFMRVCKALGGSGARTHSMDLPNAKTMRKFTYRASCGTEIELSTSRHKRLQMGQVSHYMVNATCGEIKAEDWQDFKIKVTSPVVTPSNSMTGVAKRKGVRTKADIVRELLINYGGDMATVGQDKEFVAKVIEATGHELHMAKRYIKDFSTKMRG